MLLIVLKKMFNNKWLVLCLLVGSILAVAIISSIPIYTSGMLQRMLIKDLENYQVESGNFPGAYFVSGTFSKDAEKKPWAEAFKSLDRKIDFQMVNEMKLPIVSQTRLLTFDYMRVEPLIQQDKKSGKKIMKLSAMTGIDTHINIIHGRLFALQRDNGIYEGIISEKVMKDYELLPGEIYNISNIVDEPSIPFKVKIVGVYKAADRGDGYWGNNLPGSNESIFIHSDLFYKDFIENGISYLMNADWHYNFDYHSMTLPNIKNVISKHESQARWYKKNGSSLEFGIPVIRILNEYLEREKQLKVVLWVQAVPVLLMLAFYIFMVSQLILSHEANEITVIRSRGASSGQIFAIYLYECLVISVIALITGPFLGLLFCSIVGSSNGFLEFVGRTALSLSLSPEAYFYSMAALLFFIIMMLIPAFSYSRLSIVQYKQNKARNHKEPFWKRYFLDAAALLIAGYGLYSYRSLQNTLNITGLKGTELTIDPLLFFLSTFTILGSGLLFLRVFPYIIQFISWLGHKFWPPVFYASLIQIGRAEGQEQFLMLFIILALSIGIFNANSARSINRNIEDRIRYQTGADIVVKEEWERIGINPASSFTGSGSGINTLNVGRDPVKYIEPDFSVYKKLQGVEHATKVLRRDDAAIRGSDGNYINANLIGIIPNEFGRVSWLRRELLPYHLVDYVNLMVDSPKAVLVSRSLEEEYKIKTGDSIEINWGGQSGIEGIVYAFIDYWPAFNPLSGAQNGKEKGLIVANLNYIQDKCAMEPYEVWLKKKPGVSDTVVNNEIKESSIKAVDIKYVDQEVIKKRNDPLLQGTNGTLTLNFIITMMISNIGFLIYWVMSIKIRGLQFGIFRAMGLSLRKIIGMIVFEQVMISGTAIVMGVIIGGVTSNISVPLFQVIYGASEQMIPFKVIAYEGDYIKIYTMLAIMLTVSLFLLGRIIAGIRINQVLKLGED